MKIRADLEGQKEGDFFLSLDQIVEDGGRFGGLSKMHEAVTNVPGSLTALRTGAVGLQNDLDEFVSKRFILDVALRNLEEVVQ